MRTGVPAPRPRNAFAAASLSAAAASCIHAFVSVVVIGRDR